MQEQEQPPQPGSGEPAAEPTPAPTYSSTPPPPPAAPPPATPSAPTPTATAGRPTGITILAVLAAIAGVFALLGGLALVASGGFIGATTGSGALGGLAALVGAVLIVSGAASLFFAWGAWGLQPWAWTLGVVIQAVNIVLGLFQLINGNARRPALDRHRRGNHVLPLPTGDQGARSAERSPLPNRDDRPAGILPAFRCPAARPMRGRR